MAQRRRESYTATISPLADARRMSRRTGRSSSEWMTMRVGPAGSRSGISISASSTLPSITPDEPMAMAVSRSAVNSRAGMPLIRYRTGDLVRLDLSPCRCGRTFARLRGGILGRADDMVIVRGMNIFPSAIEGVLREFAEINEFRIEVSSTRSMEEMRVLIDAQAGTGPALAQQVGDRLHDRLLLRVPCEMVESGSLPRFELKAKRVVRL